MYTPEEKQFLELNAKFRKELAELEAEIERLNERHNVLLTILFGDAPIEESEEDVVPDQTALQQLVAFLKANPGSSRSEIADVFHLLPADQIKRLLEKGKRRGLIINTGRGRGSVWYVSNE